MALGGSSFAHTPREIKSLAEPRNNFDLQVAVVVRSHFYASFGLRGTIGYEKDPGETNQAEPLSKLPKLRTLRTGRSFRLKSQTWSRTKTDSKL